MDPAPMFHWSSSMNALRSRVRLADSDKQLSDPAKTGSASVIKNDPPAVCHRVLLSPSESAFDPDRTGQFTIPKTRKTAECMTASCSKPSVYSLGNKEVKTDSTH